jgi:phosphate starvation-inducible PhoH-like protein
MTQSVKRNRTVNFDISLSDEQAIAKEQILNHPFNFIEGRAGSGKTLLAVQIALDLLFKKTVSKVVIARPTVSTEDNGFLPGSLSEKMLPWLIPIRDNMRKVYNHPEKLTKMEEEGDIELIALSHFRGRTFENCVCIIDEYQNLTKQQLSMAIGRLGKDSIMIFCGDGQQIDLRASHDSAVHAVKRIESSNHVYRVYLKENHRHSSVDEVLGLLLNEQS